MASARQFDDIVEVQENTKGNDFVIGDVHGNRPVLEKMFNALGNDDRLFIVGDLVDKGVDSIGVIEFLNQHTDKIFVIRGNHESLCLDAISSLVTMARGQSQYGGDWKGNLQKIVEIIKTDPENCIQRLLPGNFDTADNRKLINDLKLHMVLNSGEWLANQFLNELLADKITFKSVEEKSDIGLVTKKDYVEFASDSKIKMIQDYMIRLPYIMSVSGKNSFNIVHADMPFDDSELKNRLNTNKKLSDAEKNYATWARQNDQYIPYINNGRTKDSILTVVGHSIIGGNVPVIRAQTNTIDLDAAAYSTDSFLIYSVQSKSAGFILTDRDDVNQYVKAHMVILNDYLSSGKKASLAEEKDVVRYDPDESVFDDPAILTKDSAGGVVKEQEVFDDPDYLIGRHEVDYLSSTASISQVIPVGEYTVYSEEEAEEQNPDNLAKSKSPDDITPESAKDENPEVLKRPSS